MIYHRVHSALEEVSSLHDPITKHFILADSEEQECTRTVVFACYRVLLQLETNCSMCLEHWRLSLTSAVLPHSNDALLGSVAEVSNQTLPVGRPFHVGALHHRGAVLRGMGTFLKA